MGLRTKNRNVEIEDDWLYLYHPVAFESENSLSTCCYKFRFKDIDEEGSLSPEEMEELKLLINEADLSSWFRDDDGILSIWVQRDGESFEIKFKDYTFAQMEIVNGLF